ncbi:Murein DD-endopeptidase MepM and murein hydrolase activator NlpD, contain LysM domain [Enhydrobacter aerosaccus]|uniref:Murein DD-endopeptidase MepM and murein hydrolase activator NlpD, contain LysM domain n=1 Tax=Enhydrobacter aerosaccus TaxID=225324 RepID=A0A1T4S6W6_9HYPH|nr:M23 family metallopeptidase [Enhydrobacter aerosaccus]SKA23983.1 Murein DD-endopeptidase MepM and murein hydrolase activator NlpD, contain LysM domain [Enhydrobacter aerosaccus]
MPHQAARADYTPHAGENRPSTVVSLASRRDPAASPKAPTFVVLRPPRQRQPGKLGLAFSVAVVVAASVLIVATMQRLPMLDLSRLRLAEPVAAISAEPRDESRAPDPDAFLASQIPPPDELPPPPAMASQDVVRESQLHLAKGGTLAGLLGGLDLDRQEINRALAALAPHLSLRRLPAGQEIQVRTRLAAAGDGAPSLEGLTIRPEVTRQLLLERLDSGAYRVSEKVFETVKRVMHAAGTIRGSLIASLHAADLPMKALTELLHAFSWDVNFQHDIKLGDRFATLIEQSWTEDGQRIDDGRLLWARLTTGGGRQSFSVYRFKPQGGREFFYNRDGESVMKALLRTPLDLARVTISSNFGRRMHPLLGFTRMHEGVDFAAPPGTPVLAAGDGKIVQAGPNGGYGNWVEIQHGGGLATGYAHLLRLAPGIRPGVQVRQSQVVGFVGSTGLSTGPHLHFELRRAGLPVNPLGVAQQSLRQRLKGRDLDRFKQVVERIDHLVRGEKAAVR